MVTHLPGPLHLGSSHWQDGLDFPILWQLESKKSKSKTATPSKLGPELAQHHFFVFSILLVRTSHKASPTLHWSCAGSRGGIPLWTKVMRKEARHTQMRDRASGVHPDVLEHLPPKKKTGVCLLYCFVLSPLISLGAVPHHHLALSVKELTYSSNS